MQVDLLASRPHDYDVPGDKYREMPPWPRVKMLDTGIIDNHRDIDSLDPSQYEVIPGCLGIMHINSELLGVSKDYAVWRMGFIDGSPAAEAYGVSLPTGEEHGYGFIWLLCKRRSGKVVEEWRGWATNLPDNFRRVIEAPVVMQCIAGRMVKPQFYAPTNNRVRKTAMPVTEVNL